MISLFWTTPQDTGSYSITDYLVEYSDDDTTWNTLTHGDDSTYTTITNLTNGQLYYFRVSSITDVGTSDTSEIISDIPSTVPNAPTDLIVIVNSDDTDLYWTEPINDGGNDVTDYLIEYSNNYGNTWNTFIDDVTTDTLVTITGLDDDEYYFRVSAGNDNGYGDTITTDGNILDYDSYRITSGNPSIFSNSSGITISGTGTIIVEMEFNGEPDDNTTSTLFSYGISNGIINFLNNPLFNPVDNVNYESMCIDTSDITWYDSNKNYNGSYRDLIFHGYYTDIDDTNYIIQVQQLRVHNNYDNYYPNLSEISDFITDPLCSNVGFMEDATIFNITTSYDSANTTFTYTGIGGYGSNSLTSYSTDGEIVENPEYDNYFLYVTLNDGDVFISGEYYTSKVLPPNDFEVDIGNQLVNFSWECPAYDGIGYDNECDNITEFNLYRNGELLSTLSNDEFEYTDYEIPLEQINIYKMTSTNNVGTISGYSKTITVDSVEIPTIDELTSDMLSRTDESITIVFPNVISTTDIDMYEITRTVFDATSYRVDGSYDSFTDEDDIDEDSQPCYQIRVKNFLGWSDYTDAQCVDDSTEVTDTNEIEFDIDILLSVVPTNDNTYLTSVKYQLESDDKITLEYFKIYFEADEDNITTITVDEELEYDNYLQYVNYITYNDDLEDSDNNVIIKTKYDGYLITTNTFNVDYLVDLEESNEVPNSNTDYILNVDNRYVLYAEIDDDTIDTNCTVSDLHGIEFSDDGSNGYILIDSEYSSSRYYINCTINDVNNYSDIYKADKTLKNTIEIFDDTFGKFAGVDIGVMFIIFVASVFTKRNAYIGLFVIGVTTAIMVLLDVIELTTDWFALIVVLMILGILTGRKL